jgi:hypothetical protein
MLILQICPNSPKTPVGLRSDKSAAMSGDVHGSVGIAGEATDMDIMIEEMSVVKVEEDTFMDIKKEEILIHTSEEHFHGDVTSHTLKAEQDKVSHICFSFIGYILLISHNVRHLLLSAYLCLCL